jgi:peptidoglycan/xylan/chitin deacetylase (PgdA/CDA1 family)
MHPVLALHALTRLHAPAILCLHSVGRGPDALPEPVFRGLLDALKERCYRFLTADDVIHMRVLRNRAVLLTFDDGRQDNVDVVLPILREYGIPATFYICSGLMGRQVRLPSHPDRSDASEQSGLDHMDWAAVQQLQAAGMCIGSHGATHRELTRCTDEELAREVTDSRQQISSRLKIPVRHFSYPWGRFDARVLRAVRKAGYQTAAAVSVNPVLPVRPWDEFTLSRITVHPAASHTDLMRLIGFGNLVRRTASQVRRCAMAGLSSNTNGASL